MTGHDLLWFWLEKKFTPSADCMLNDRLIFYDYT